MTGTKGDSQYRYQLVFNCLKELSQFVPVADWPVTALQDLREFLSQVSAPSVLADTHGGPPTTSSDALALVTFAHNSLYLVNDSPLDSVWGGEAVARITHILEDLTNQLGLVVRREKADLLRGLYVIIDPLVTGGRDPLDVATAAVRGGARMLQLRDKQRDKGESLPLARSLQKLCQTSGTLLIINDHADVAAVVGAAGLHVGQTDLPVTEARKVLAHQQVLGRSNHEIEELVESERMGADHVAFGPIYLTGTKNVGHSPQGIGKLLTARKTAKTPLVAIGGINVENAAAVIEAGADAICVTAAVGSAADPEAAAAQLVRVIEDAGGRI